MYFFFAAPAGYRKVFFVLKAWSSKKRDTLPEFYVRTRPQLIPKDVEILEYAEQVKATTKTK